MADRQVSPTFCSGLFCHAASVRRESGNVNFRLRCAATRQAAFRREIGMENTIGRHYDIKKRRWFKDRIVSCKKGEAFNNICGASRPQIGDYPSAN
jgi:hypothetical protein